eukprot:Pgem_evm1s6845
MTYKQCQENPLTCKQNPKNTNQYGYGAHFDLMNYYGQIRTEPNHLGASSSLNWDNAEVYFERVHCSEWYDQGLQTLRNYDISTVNKTECPNVYPDRDSVANATLSGSYGKGPYGKGTGNIVLPLGVSGLYALVA